MPKIKLICKSCGAFFYRKPSEVEKGSTFCSRACTSRKKEIKCNTCGTMFKKKLSQITEFNYCTKECFHKSLFGQSRVLICDHCNIEFSLEEYLCKREVKFRFCSKSCRAKFYAKIRKLGAVSKLEIWLQEKLFNLYPNIQFSFNNREVVGLELDIYLPKLQLAFEINGPTHYTPIYGIKQLKHVQSKDILKFSLCENAGIELFVVDSSHQIKVNKDTSKVFLEYICQIIDEKIEGEVSIDEITLGRPRLAADE